MFHSSGPCRECIVISQKTLFVKHSNRHSNDYDELVNTIPIIYEMNITIACEGYKDLVEFRFKQSLGIKCKSTPYRVELFLLVNNRKQEESCETL